MTTRPSDINGDGTADVLWRDAYGDVSLWDDPGTASFAVQDLGTVGLDWAIQGTADFSGDGSADILWRNADGDVSLWDSVPGVGGTAFSVEDLGTVGLGWSIQATADFTGDGKADILWRNAEGDVSLWASNPGSGAPSFSVQDLGMVSLDWTIQGTGDFNGDGKADILWRNADGDVSLWDSNSGAAVAPYSAQDLGVAGYGWGIQAIADFNGDGRADILWRNADGDVSLWDSNPGPAAPSFAVQDLGMVGLDWTIQAVGDFTGDGKADILWRNANGDVSLWASTPGTAAVSFSVEDLGFAASAWSVQPQRSLSTTPASLTVAGNSGATPINIAAPTDLNYPAAQLTVTVSMLPSDGSVLLSDGVTPVSNGEVLTVAQLVGLEFAPTPSTFGQNSTFAYTVTDPSGSSVSGGAMLAIAPNTTPPSTTPASLTVGENAGPTAIGIVAPTDPNYSASQLSVTINSLPSDGTVLLSDGVTPVNVGQVLSVAALSGLQFLATPGTSAASSTLAYTVSNPSGFSTAGNATLAITPGVEFAPAAPQPSQSGDIVGLQLQNTTGTSENGGYVTFGEVFASGAVKPTDSLVARINGVNYAVQMDVKSTNADGSVRQAVLTLLAPAIAPGGSIALMLAEGSAAGPSNPAPTAAALLGSGYDTLVNFTFHNTDGSTTTDSASAAAALQAALNAGTVSNWLSGPEVNEYDVVTTVDGGKLKVEFDIRAYADGTTTTDVIFDNSWMFSPGKTDLNYDVSISQGGNQVYSANGVNQYLYSMWHHEVDSAGTISPNIQYDVPYLIAAGALPAYDTSIGVSGAAIQGSLAAVNSTDPPIYAGPTTATRTGPMGTGSVAVEMGTAGGRSDIGPQPNWVAQWVLSQDPSALAAMMANADAAGSIPWYFTDENTGKPINEQTYPTFWQDPRNIAGSGLSPQPANGWPAYGSSSDPWIPDAAHQPDLNYIPYLITGSHYRLDELQAQANYSITSIEPYYDYYSNGAVVNPTNPGNALFAGQAAGQQRGIAWDIRQVAEAAYVTPDNDPLKSYFVSELTQTMQGLVQYYITDSSLAQYQDIRGFIEGNEIVNGAPIIAPWQQGYIVTALAEVAAMNIPQASADAVQMLRYMNNFIAGLYTNGSNGYNPLNGAAYWLYVADPTTGTPFNTWAQLQQENIALYSTNTSGWGLATTDPTQLDGATDTGSGIPTIAKAALADEITYAQSPQAIQAYGFVVSQIAYSFAQINQSEAAAYQSYPQWSVMPRLPDGVYLQNSQMQIDTSGASSVMLTARGGDSLLAVVGSGTATLTGGAGSCDLLFAGSGPTTLIAGTGNDFMFGGSASNTFIDNTGNDYMQGGTGPNTFTFTDVHSGHDTIANFNIATDVLRISTNLNGNAITSAADLLAGATVTNGNVVLHLSPNDDIALVGIGTPTTLLNSIVLF